MPVRRQRIHVASDPVGSSHLVESYAEAPLRLFGPWKIGEAVGVILAQLGGVLGGDCWETEVVVDAGASLHLSTQAATHLLNMPTKGATHRLSLTVGRGSTLVYRPHAIIPHAGAWYQQDVRINLNETGRLLMTEILAAGRITTGERFRFQSLESCMRVMPTDGPWPLYWERQRFCPAREPLDVPAAWGDWPVLGTLWWFERPPESQKTGLEPPWVRRVWEILMTLDDHLAYREPSQRAVAAALPVSRAVGGIGRLPCGWMIRVLADTAEAVLPLFEEVTDRFLTGDGRFQ